MKKYQGEIKCEVYIPVVIEAESIEDANEQFADAIRNHSFDMNIVYHTDTIFIDRYVLGDIATDFDPDVTEEEYDPDETEED